MIYEHHISVPFNESSTIRAALSWKQGDNPLACMSEDESISFIAIFANGYQIDIHCKGRSYAESDNGSAWTRAVLYNPDGEYVATTPILNEFFRVWTITDDRGDEYRVTVVDENS